MILVGTAGFSYPDWRGVFYPEGMHERDFLTHYSKQFPFVELDFTYYAQPRARTLAAMAKKVPEGFKFTVKAHKSLTHEISEGQETNKEFETFLEGISPLVQSGRLGCVLAQFPWSFKPSPENREYLGSLKQRLAGLPTVVEFRNRAWAQEDTFELLRQCGLGFCCVDEPRLPSLFPPVAVATGPTGYVRFHGRNAEKWFKHEQAWERYDYMYSEQELLEWVPRLRDMETKTEETYVAYNNCHRGQAALNARMLQELLLRPQ